MTGATEDINTVSFKKILKRRDRAEKTGFSFYINREKNRLRKTRLPDLQKELPVDEWTMPDQPEGYIKCRDKDLF